MQLPLATHLPFASPSQPLLTRRLLPLFIAAFSQGLVLWAPVEKVFLKSLGFDQATLGLMAACYATRVPLLDLTSGLLADRWSRKGVLILASVASMLNALLGGLSHDVPTYLVSTLVFGVEVALVSGTYESILYDTLLEHTGHSHAFEQRLGQVKLLSSLALLLSSLADWWPRCFLLGWRTLPPFPWWPFPWAPCSPSENLTCIAPRGAPLSPAICGPSLRPSSSEGKPCPSSPFYWPPRSSSR